MRSFTIATYPPNELYRQIHNRMWVIVPPATWPLWLGEDAAEPERPTALLDLYPAEDMKMWPVSARVGNVMKNDPSLVEPIELAAT